MISDTNEAPRREKKIITVTLNPSLDRTLTTHFLSLGYHNRTTDTTRLDPAGRGVNVSRALQSIGVPTHAIVLVGHDATGRAYQALLAEEQFPITILRREGRTRSNISILDTGHNHQTIILEECGEMTRADRQAVANTLIELTEPGDTVVFAGSLPPGARDDTYALLTSLAQTKGAAVAVNAGGGEPLLQALRARPMLLYLTQTQAEGLFNFPVRAYEDVLYCAHQLQDQGATRVLVAMEKPEGAFLVTEAGAWMAKWPEISGTRSGRAEALIAEYLAARLQRRPFEEALRLAAAATAFTISQVGHEFGTMRDIEQYLEQVTVISTDHLIENPDTQT
jgi:1-phosphofructokinase